MVAEPQLPDALSFSSFSIVTFDLYDTLIDGEKAIYDNIILSLRNFPECAKWLNPSRRAFLMEQFAFQEGVVLADHPEMPSLVVLEQAHYRLLAQTLHIEDVTLQHSRDFANHFYDWPVVEDTRAAMRTLQALGYKLVAVSNWDPETTNRVLAGNLMGLGIHKMYTAQGIGSYRLDSKSLAKLLTHVMEDYGADERDVLHIAHGSKDDPHFSEQLGVTTVSIARDASSDDETNPFAEEIPKHEADAHVTGKHFKSLAKFAEACKQSFVITVRV